MGGGGGGGTEYPQSGAFADLERERLGFESEQADFEEMMYLYQMGLSNQAAQSRSMDIGLYGGQLNNPFSFGYDAALNAANLQQQSLLQGADAFDAQAGNFQGLLQGMQAPTLDMRSLSGGFGGTIGGFGPMQANMGGGLSSLFNRGGMGGFGAAALGGNTANLPVLSYYLDDGQARPSPTVGGQNPEYMRELTPEVLEMFNKQIAAGDISHEQLALSQAYRMASGIADTRFFSPDYGVDFAKNISQQAQEGLLPQQQQQRRFLENLQKQQEESMEEFEARRNQLQAQMKKAMEEADIKRRQAEKIAEKSDILARRGESENQSMFERFFELQRQRRDRDEEQASISSARTDANSRSIARMRKQITELNRSRSGRGRPLPR